MGMESSKHLRHTAISKNVLNYQTGTFWKKVYYPASLLPFHEFTCAQTINKHNYYLGTWATCDIAF